MNIFETLKKMVTVARKAHRMDTELNRLGYPETPYAEIYGDTVDAICFLIGDYADTFQETATFQALMNPDLSDTQCTNVLYNEFEKFVANSYVEHSMAK